MKLRAFPQSHRLSFCVAALASGVACSESSSPGSLPPDGGTLAAGAASGNGGAGGGAGNGNRGGDGGSSAGGSASTGEPPLNVPRTETGRNSTSALDSPRPGLSASGLCPGLAVSCNGSCLDAEGASAGNCSVLIRGLGQTRSVALGEDALYYTSGSDEILKTVLSTGAHSSVVRGFTFPAALRVSDGNLYFSARAQVDFPPNYEVKRVALAGGEVTVLSQPFTASDIELIEPVGEELLFTVGNFEQEFYTVPRGGGRAERRTTVKGVVPVVDGNRVYFRQDGYARVLTLEPPYAVTAINQVYTNSRLLLEGGYLYLLYHSDYLRAPSTGGAMEEVQTMPVATTDAGVTKEMYLLGRTQSHALLVQDDVPSENLVTVSLMPIAGGPITPLVTLESGEYQAHAATATHLYVAVGESHAGAILKIALP